MKEKPYLIALVCDLSNINMERKSNKFTDLHFYIRSLLRQYGKHKSLRIVEKNKQKNRYSAKPYTVTSDWQKFQMKLHYKPCDEISVQAECLDEITFSK